MSKLRKIGIWGLVIVVCVTVTLKLAGIFPGIAAAFALPFCMLLLIDFSRKPNDKNEDPS